MEITSQQLYFAAWVIFVIFIFFMYMNLQSNDHQLYTPAGTPQNWQDFDDDEDTEGWEDYEEEGTPIISKFSEFFEERILSSKEGYLDPKYFINIESI